MYAAVIVVSLVATATAFQAGPPLVWRPAVRVASPAFMSNDMNEQPDSPVRADLMDGDSAVEETTPFLLTLGYCPANVHPDARARSGLSAHRTKPSTASRRTHM